MTALASVNGVDYLSTWLTAVGADITLPETIAIYLLLGELGINTADDM